jgi:hypothetical protein
MAEAPPNQHEPRAVRAAVALVALAPLAALALPVGTDPAHPLIRATALPAVAFWCFGGWRAGAVACAAHVCAAFHLGHGWSHAAAWEHTREASGFGDGVFVNYAVVAVWLADAVKPARGGWRWWLVRGFVAFVMVNAAVVFGSELARMVFVFALLLALRVRNHVPWPYPRGYR